VNAAFWSCGGTSAKIGRHLNVAQARALWTPPRKESMTDEESSREDVFCPHCGAISHTDCILAEREACALVADALAAQWQDEGAIQGACIAADAIRARGKR